MHITDEHIVDLASRMFGVSPDTIKRYRTMSKIDLGNITLLDMERNVKMKSTLKILERILKIEKIKNGYK